MKDKTTVAFHDLWTNTGEGGLTMADQLTNKGRAQDSISDAFRG